MALSKAHEEWVVAEGVARSAASLLEQHLGSGRVATVDQLAELERLRVDAAAKLRTMLEDARSAGNPARS